MSVRLCVVAPSRMAAVSLARDAGVEAVRVEVDQVPSPEAVLAALDASEGAAWQDWFGNLEWQGLASMPRIERRSFNAASALTKPRRDPVSVYRSSAIWPNSMVVRLRWMLRRSVGCARDYCCLAPRRLRARTKAAPYALAPLDSLRSLGAGRGTRRITPRGGQSSD